MASFSIPFNRLALGFMLIFQVTTSTSIQSISVGKYTLSSSEAIYVMSMSHFSFSFAVIKFWFSSFVDATVISTKSQEFFHTYALQHHPDAMLFTCFNLPQNIKIFYPDFSILI